jgi:hypothetical protein
LLATFVLLMLFQCSGESAGVLFNAFSSREPDSTSLENAMIDTSSMPAGEPRTTPQAAP